MIVLISVSIYLIIGLFYSRRLFSDLKKILEDYENGYFDEDQYIKERAENVIKKLDIREGKTFIASVLPFITLFWLPLLIRMKFSK